MWDLSWLGLAAKVEPPRGVTDDRPGIWVSFVPEAEVARDLRSLVLLDQHRQVALPAYVYEQLRIGSGPPPIRVDEGWLLIHHGVDGELMPGWERQTRVRYTAGALLLDHDDVTAVLARTPEPLLVPELPEERAGVVDNVVFPTAIEELDGVRYVFYGMADARIGVALLGSVSR